MPKGKKFNAAEKHFKGKEDKYRKQIQTLYDELTTVSGIVVANECTIKELTAINLKLKDDIEALIAVSAMSKEQFEEMRADTIALRQAQERNTQSLKAVSNLIQHIPYTGGLI